MLKINLSELGKMLNKAFSTNEIDGLAFSLFLNLQDEIAGFPKSKKVIEVIKHAVNHGKLDQVIKYTERENPTQYKKFESVLYVDSETLNPVPFSSNTPESDDANDDVKIILSKMTDLMGEMLAKGRGDQITINADKVKFAGKGGTVTDKSKNHSIDNVGDNSTINQGDGSQTISSRSVHVGGKNTGTIITGDGNTVTDNSKTQNITFGDNTNISGTFNAIVADTIQNAFNTVENSGSSEEIKTLIKTMLEAVEKTAKEAPSEQQNEVEDLAKFSKRLADDAISSKPDEEDSRFSLKKLTKAAENIGSLAVPVVAAAKSILRALGFAI